VKTQAASVYRKFGVSSRRDAIARMSELRLLSHD
jgi:ATP/maltotriose-dependent transcriptional regulator MalT